MNQPDDVLRLTPDEVTQLERLLNEPAAPSQALADLIAELDDSVEELVTETTRLAWSPILHDNTVDTATVEAAADHLKEQLGEQ